MPPALKRWGPPRRQGLCSQPAHLWATSDSAPRCEAVRTLQAAGLCSHPAHLWATTNFAPRCEAVGTPGGSGYEANRPTCGPLLILPPAVKRWGPSRWQGLCSHLDHLWAAADSTPRSEAVGTPHGGRGYVVTWPTFGPLLIPPPALKRWGPPMRQGLFSHLAHLWTTSDSAPHYEAVGTLEVVGVM